MLLAANVISYSYTVITVHVSIWSLSCSMSEQKMWVAGLLCGVMEKASDTPGQKYKGFFSPSWLLQVAFRNIYPSMLFPSLREDDVHSTCAHFLIF